MNENKLLPCPFCGGSAECYDEELYDGGGNFRGFSFLVTCGTNNCYGNAYKLETIFYSAEHAILNWNDRK